MIPPTETIWYHRCHCSSRSNSRCWHLELLCGIEYANASPRPEAQIIDDNARRIPASDIREQIVSRLAEVLCTDPAESYAGIGTCLVDGSAPATARGIGVGLSARHNLRPRTGARMLPERTAESRAKADFGLLRAQRRQAAIYSTAPRTPRLLRLSMTVDGDLLDRLPQVRSLRAAFLAIFPLGIVRPSCLSTIRPTPDTACA